MNNDLADILESKIGSSNCVKIGKILAEEIVKALRGGTPWNKD